MGGKTDRQDWLKFMSDEDLSFICRFVLASGSLKEVAKVYEVSYPTVRLRLDRLIEKIRVVQQQEELSDFERLLRTTMADGLVDSRTMKLILKAHEAALHKREKQS